MKRIIITSIVLLLSYIGMAQTPAGSAFAHVDPNNAGFVNCGNNAAFNMSGSFTVECWIARTDLGANDKLIGNTSIGDGFVFGLQNGIYVEIWQPAKTELVDVGTFPGFFTWTHVAITFQPGGELRAYINGDMVGNASVASGNISVSSNDMVIGTAPWDYNSLWYDGLIDEMRIWNVEKTSSEIKSLMHTSLTGSEANLLAYYNFNEGSGTIAANSSVVSGIDGSLTGNGAGWSSPSYAVLGSSTMMTMNDVQAMWLGMTNDPVGDLRVVNTTNGLSVISTVDSLNYLLFGHDSASGVTTADLPTEATDENYERASRTWFIEPQTINSNFESQLVFDLSDVADGGTELSSSEPVENYALFKRDAATGTFSAVVNASIINGDKVIFDDVELVSGYYTIGVGDASLFASNSLGNDIFSRVSVSPNPANEVLNLSIEKDLNLDNMSLVMFDVLGNQVITQQINSNFESVDVSSLSAGVYNIMISSDREVGTKTVIVK